MSRFISDKVLLFYFRVNRRFGANKIAGQELVSRRDAEEPRANAEVFVTVDMSGLTPSNGTSALPTEVVLRIMQKQMEPLEKAVQ